MTGLEFISGYCESSDNLLFRRLWPPLLRFSFLGMKSVKVLLRFTRWGCKLGTYDWILYFSAFFWRAIYFSIFLRYSWLTLKFWSSSLLFLCLAENTSSLGTSLVWCLRDGVFIIFIGICCVSECIPELRATGWTLERLWRTVFASEFTPIVFDD